MNSKAQAPKGKPVEILPVTVSIRILTVNNKQMTLSVFRQLPEKKAYDDQWNSIGNWWGRVNYEFANYKGGFWIVFESEGILHKCWVDSEEVDGDSYTKEIASEVMKTLFKKLDSTSLSMLISHLQECGRSIPLPIEMRRDNICLKIQILEKEELEHELEIVVTDGTDSRCTLVRYGYGYDIDLESKYVGFFKTTIVSQTLLLNPNYLKRWEKKIKAGDFPELSTHEIALEISNTFQSMRDLPQSTQSIRELSDRIYSLPQLFIAV